MTTPSRTGVCVARGLEASVGVFVGVGEAVFLLGVDDGIAFVLLGVGKGVFGVGVGDAVFLLKTSVL